MDDSDHYIAVGPISPHVLEISNTKAGAVVEAKRNMPFDPLMPPRRCAVSYYVVPLPVLS